MKLQLATHGQAEIPRRRAMPAAAAARQQEHMVRNLAAALHAELLQTPISWLLLSRHQAWKIKKAVLMPFLDFRKLSAREHFCHEEVRLNRRLAGTLYKGVVPVGGTVSHPLLGGRSQAIDYAVHMRRFPDGSLAGTRLAEARLSGADVDRLASLLGSFHASARPAPVNGPFGGIAQRLGVALAALQGATGAMPKSDSRELARWMHEQCRILADLWSARREQGFVRECHGDLHLDNLLILRRGAAAFDCIEFDPLLRFIDVIDDIAFPVMDFSAAGRNDLAFRLLDGWLDATGDHAGLPGLRFSVVYRALVRAQVALLQGGAGRDEARRYVRTAIEWTHVRAPHLTVMHGLPGSGKTTVSQRLLESQAAIRIRSDVERKRLFGLEALADSQAAGLRIYGKQAGERTYAQLFARARTALQAGYPVILDAAFLHRHEREQARKLAAELNVQFVIASCEASDEELRQRLARRQADASEADARVLHGLRAHVEPLAPSEQGFVQHFRRGFVRHTFRAR